MFVDSSWSVPRTVSETRWRLRGWRPREQHPLEVDRERLGDGVPILTADAMTTARDLVVSVERGELEKLPEGELLRRAAREAAIAVSVVGHAFLRQPRYHLQTGASLPFYFEHSPHAFRLSRPHSRKWWVALRDVTEADNSRRICWHSRDNTRSHGNGVRHHVRNAARSVTVVTRRAIVARLRGQ